MNKAFTVPAARGAALLDQVVPGWYNLIDTETLDISSGHYCVAGQIGRARYPVLHATDGYLGVVRMIVPPARRDNIVPEVYRNGFCVSPEQVVAWKQEVYELQELPLDLFGPDRLLTDAWMSEIHARRALDQAVTDAATAEAQVETEAEVDRTPVLV